MDRPRLIAAHSLTAPKPKAPLLGFTKPCRPELLPIDQQDVWRILALIYLEVNG